MSVKIIYFVHGTTYDNATGKCSGWKQVKLNDLGKEQAKNLGNIVKDLKIDMIFTSDLTRAIDSANIIWPNSKKIQDRRLRECNYGDYDGESKELVNYEEHINNPFPNGESMIDVEKRVRDFCRYLLMNYNNQSIAIVAHRATQLALEVITMDKTWEQAIKDDWRDKKQWQPGWNYTIEDELKI